MPTATVTIDIDAASDDIFDLIHDYSRRLEWDSFLRKAMLLNGAQIAGRGVSSRCVARRAIGGLAMDTVYVTFARPDVAAVAMTNGPFFLSLFAASIRQERIAENKTRVSYHYNFKARPRCLAFLLEPVVGWVFRRETRQRLAGLKRCLEARQTTGSCDNTH